VPEVSFSAPPPLKPPTTALPGSLVPMTRIDGVNVPDPPKPPVVPPAPPPKVGALSDVLVELNCSLKDSCSETTFFRSKRALTLLALSGVPLPANPKAPAGETVMVVPVEDRTELILDSTALRAMSMEIDRAMATAKMTTTPTERMVLRKALRTPRRREFTGVPFGSLRRSYFSARCKRGTNRAKSEVRIDIRPSTDSPTVEDVNELPVSEGTIPFREFETWYRVTGDLNSALTPLVVAHGGPGCSHDYLLSLAELARSGRAVVHYDQLGGGRSTHLPDAERDFWTVELFLEELDNLLVTLGIAAHYHLLGQSWGGMLGAEHAIRQPSGLRALVLSNSPASMDLWVSEALVLRSQMPPTIAEALDRHEADGSTNDPEYLAATQAYYDEHVCRVVPNPPEVVRTFEIMSHDSTVYNTMNGPNEFFCIGTLRGWTVVERVRDILAPTLLLSGRHDEATPATIQPFLDNIADVRWEIFEDSSHMPFVEEPERYRAVVEEFLAAHDAD